MAELVKVTGMVISTMAVGEYDKRVVILTKERGKIHGFARGAKRPGNSLMAAAQPFVFGEFMLLEGRSAYTISSVKVMNYFEEFRKDMDATCYGCYFLEFADYYGRENADDLEMLKLLYQTVRALCTDFHHVLRSKYLCLRFRLANIPVAFICKGRAGKKKLVRRRHKVLENQKSSFRRYADVLEKLGLPVLLNFSSIYGEGKGDFAEIEPMTGPKGKQKWIGIAPFAKHKGKIYPLELQEQVVAHFAANPAVKVFLFGGGKSEQEVFDSWIAKYPSVVSMIGKLNMRTELNLMSHLDVMLSMDSANMHLASLVNIPVVSVWGATHPYAGFMGWKQLPVNTVQLDLSCRPCSVYGQKPCWRGDYACLRDITPEQVIAKIEGIID